MIKFVVIATNEKDKEINSEKNIITSQKKAEKYFCL